MGADNIGWHNCRPPHQNWMALSHQQNINTWGVKASWQTVFSLLIVFDSSFNLTLLWITAWYQLLPTISVKKWFKFKFHAITFLFFFMALKFPRWICDTNQTDLVSVKKKKCCLEFSVTWTHPSLTETCVLEMKRRTCSLVFALPVLALSAVETHNQSSASSSLPLTSLPL